MGSDIEEGRISGFPVRAKHEIRRRTIKQSKDTQEKSTPIYRRLVDVLYFEEEAAKTTPGSVMGDFSRKGWNC